MNLFNRFMNDDNGATLIEYALVVALIAIVAITALTTLGGNVTSAFDTISGELQ